MAINDEILKELLKDCKNPEDIVGQNGLIKQLTKRLLEKVLTTELSEHLGYDKYEREGQNSGNSRNGKGSKVLVTDHGEMEIETPRDRNGTFEPQIIKKRQKRFDGFDDKILSMYARGMSVRDIQGHLKDIYGVEVSPDLISSVTEKVIDDVQAWQTRPLSRLYPIVYLDAVRIKIRDNGHILNKAVYLAMGVGLDGNKDVLGMWIAETEGAKFWAMILTEIRNRGVEDIYIICVDGLKGFSEAIGGIYPKAQVQLCIVHMIRNSMRYVPWKDRKEVMEMLKPIYTAANAAAAEESLKAFCAKWDGKYSTIGDLWRRNWEGIIPFLGYPDYIRRAIYTTNAIESLNHSLRKITKNRGSFPNNESALKLLYLGLNNAKKKWTMPIREWKQALNQFAVLFADRFPLELE
jgi:putative transposase